MLILFDFIILIIYYLAMVNKDAELKKFGVLIKEVRLASGLSTQALSKMANISRPTLWSIEKGTDGVSLGTYLQIANILGIDLNLSFNHKLSVHRKRSPKRITKQTTKQNSFEVFCIEMYANHSNQNSSQVYSVFKNEKLLDLLRNDYEDLHGMGTEYLMELFDSYLEKKAI